MAQLRELHLQFSFKTARSLGENIENQATAIQYPALQALLQIALLPRTQGGARYDEFRFVFNNATPEILDLAFADEVARIWADPAADQLIDNNGARRSGEFCKLLALPGSGCAAGKTLERRPTSGSGSGFPAEPSSPPRSPSSGRREITSSSTGADLSNGTNSAPSVARTSTS